MKTILATIATVAFGLIALPEKAEARPHHVGHSYTYATGTSACGCPIYQRRVVSSYDRYHRPIYRYYSVPVVHRCSSHHSSPYYRGHSSHRGHGHYDRHRGSNHRSHSGYRHSRRSSVSFSTGRGHITIRR